MQAVIKAPHYTINMRESLQMTGGVLSSLGFHALVLLLIALGLPHTKPEPLTINTPVTIEIAEIDELTQSDRLPLNTPPPEKVQEQAPPEPPPPAMRKPPKMTAEAPPDLASPQAPDTSQVAEEIPLPPEPEPLERKEIEKPKPQQKPPPPPSKPVTKKPEPPAAANDFQTLLKNLAPDVEETQTQGEAPELDSNAAQPSPLAQRAMRITVGEEEALRAQLAKCWNVLSGARYAEDLVVEVAIIVNPDRTVNSARVTNEFQNIGNPHFRAAADAALRALRNPRCSPLALPPEKYESWKNTVIRFDPRDML